MRLKSIIFVGEWEFLDELPLAPIAADGFSKTKNNTVDRYSEENIISFVKDLAGLDKITSQTDIFFDLGVTGDDFHELIDEYSKKFNVDMFPYLWYFHADEEGNSFGVSFFKPPYERVKRIPVTPKMLSDFANKGKWSIAYPEHTLPKRRYDIIINRVLVFGFLIYIAIKLLNKYVFT